MQEGIGGFQGQCVGAKAHPEANVAWADRSLPSRESTRRNFAMITHHHQGGAQPRAASIQTYARMAGVVFLIAVVAGGFGEAYAPSQLLVAGNAAATAHNIVTHALF